MSSSAKADATLTPRLKSAVLWGVVGALVFLVLHQAYLLLDGEFLGVGPVAAVAVAVFAATVVASYFTAGHLEVFEPDETTVVSTDSGGSDAEAPDAGAPGAVTAPDAKSESVTAPDAEAESVTDSDEAESATGSEPEPEPDEAKSVADGSVGGAPGDGGTTDGESDDDTEDEWIWGDRDS